MTCNLHKGRNIEHVRSAGYEDVLSYYLHEGCRGDDLTKLIITVHVSQLRADYLPGRLLEPQLRYRGGDGQNGVGGLRDDPGN